VCYIDEGADDHQAAALTQLVQGQLGGPWAIFINTYDLAGPHPALFTINLTGDSSVAAIGGVAELELEPIRNPVSDAEVHPEVILPEGIVMKRGALVASKVFRVHDGVNYDHSGKYAAVGPFDYGS
jgi:hypothetical protein